MMSEKVTYPAKDMLPFRTLTQECRTRKHRIFRALPIFFRARFISVHIRDCFSAVVVFALFSRVDCFE